jgi:HEAT repeat protein
LAHDIGLLREHATSMALNQLIPTLEDRSREVREEVVRALGELGERMPLNCLFAPLQDQDWSVQNAAQMVLDEQGGRLLSDPALIDVLNHESEFVRSAAVSALGQQGERVSIDLLIQALQDEDESVRRAAVRALGQQGEHVSTDLLIQALQDEDRSVRSAAVRALGQQGERVQPEQLLVLVGDDDSDVRIAAIEAVRKLASAMLADVATEAIAILQGKPAGRVLGSISQGFIAEVFGSIGYSTPMVFEKLVPLLDWHYWQVQVKAALALGRIRRNIPDTAIKRLLAIRSDPSPLMSTVREAADDALSEILSLETGIEDE